MGQVYASDYVELYSINPNNQSLHQSVEKSKINESLHHAVPPIQPKPKPSQIKSANIDQIKGLRIYISQEITNEFPDLDPTSYERHDIVDGEYYGRLRGSNREGDGVLSIRRKPMQKGQQEQEEVYKFLEHIETVKLLAMDMLFLIKITLIGERSKNEIKGRGILKTKDNSTYQGIWDERKLKYGILQTQLYKYVGQFKDGLRDGLGECHYSDGTVIKGNWKQDNLSDLCQIQYPDNIVYSGYFYEGMKHGFGHLKEENYEYFGEFDRDVKNGLGLLIQPEQNQINQSQHKQKYTELMYFEGVQKGLFCEYKDKQKKQWFEINDDGTIENLDLITEKRCLAELLGQEKSLDQQKLNQRRTFKK